MDHHLGRVIHRPAPANGGPSRGWTRRLEGDRNTDLSFGLGSWPQAGWRKRGSLLVGACIALLGWQDAAQAAAEEGREPLHVAARVEGAFCSTLEAVEVEASRRSPRLRLLREATAPTGSVLIEGLATEARPGAGANLSLNVSGQAPRRRELWAKDCDELVRAVGFVISVTFDPPAPELDEPELPNDVPRPDANGAAKPAPPAEPRPVTPLDVETPVLGSTAERGTDAVRVGGASATHWRAGLGASAGLGVAPNPLWGAAAFIELDFGAVQPVSALLRLQLGAETNFGKEFAGGRATFRLWTASVFAGPRSKWGRVYVAPTGFARGGVLESQGSDTLESRQHSEPWFEAGLAMIFGVEVLSGWFWEVNGGGARPLTQYAFQFEPVVFHRVSPWLAHVGIYTSAKF